jgi:glycosyltransferase involved in cell wall biosynthesis
VRSATLRTHDVAFYVPSIGPLLAREPVSPTGGAETQIFLVSRALAARGLRVCLCAFDIPGGGIPPSRDGVDIALRSPHVRGAGTIGRVKEAMAMRRALADVDADVIVTRAAGFHVGLVALFAKLARRRFVYASAHVADFDFGVLAPKLRDSILYRLGLKLADAVVVQNDEQSFLCEARFGRAPVVIKSIAEPALMRTAEPEAFLWVGRAIWYKRPLEYVELARTVTTAMFWMVAVPGPGSEDLSAEIERAAAGVPNLRLLAPRPRSEVAHLIERAVAIVNTSDFEGMPNVFLEAWAQGVPVLALTHDPDGVVERNGLGDVAGGSPGALVELAETYWRMRHDQQECAERCRQYVAEQHAEDVIAGRWEQALNLSRFGRAGLVQEGATAC